MGSEDEYDERGIGEVNPKMKTNAMHEFPPAEQNVPMIKSGSYAWSPSARY
jgi:hypothetical protein